MVAAADWLAVALNRQKWRVVTKPGVLLLLILIFSFSGNWQGDSAWFGIGLIFSLIGDVLLMLPPSFFIAGLASFLIAHLAYIIGFNQPLILPGWGFILPVMGLVLTGGLAYRRLGRAIQSLPSGRWMRFPVMGYIIIISLMLLSAILCWLRPDWPSEAAALVSVGAMLFYISDSVLAFGRFCGPVRGERLIVIISYHLAQFAIVAGVLYRAARL